MASSVLIQTFTCHWMDCSFKASSRVDMVEHTEAHLERYLPIKRRDYLAWRTARMRGIVSGPDDSLQALANNGKATGSSSDSQPPDVHTFAAASGSSSPHVPILSHALQPPGLPSDPNALGAVDETPPSSPGAVSQIALSPVMSPPRKDKCMPSPSTVTSQRSFAALNAVSDASPQLNRDMFTSPSPGTLWSGICNMDIRSPSRNGVTSNAFRPGAYTGPLPLVIPKSPSPTNSLIPKKFVNSGSISYSDRFDPESVGDPDGMDHRFNLGANTNASAAVADSDHGPDHNEASTFIFGPVTRTRSRSRTPNPESITSRGFKRPSPETSTAPLSSGTQRKRSRSRSQSRSRSVLPPLRPLGPLPQLKPPKASAPAASSVADSTGTPKVHVETILEEKEDASMDVDTRDDAEPNRQHSADRPSDLLLPSVITGSGGDMNRRSPGPALAPEAKNIDSAIIGPSDHVDSAADNAGAPSQASQADWMYMDTQAPHSSLPDL